MTRLPAILNEINNHESNLHIGGLLSWHEPLCKKFSEDELDILGWISSRDWMPNEKFCAECAELYKKGSAWKFPSARE